ncbi:hypothetical protein H0H92_013628 [Tricholoma furcatifolium]|nr:hypothetical protein H0H92_013628 [Tricholoma furcatifolium]
MAETGTLISEGTEPEAGSKAPTTRRKGQCGRKKASLAAKTARSDTAHTKDTSALEEKDEDRSHCLPSPKCRNVFNWGSYISRDDSRSENQVYLAQRGIRANDRVANYAEQALCEEPTTPSHNISAEWRYVPDGRGEVIKSKKTRGKYTKGIFEPDDAYRQSTGVPLYRFSTAHELQTWFGRSANRKITRKTKIPKNEQEGAQTQNGPCCLLD